MTDQVPSSPQPSEVLAGSIERVTFHNAENGFCELRSKARGHRAQACQEGTSAFLHESPLTSRNTLLQ